MEWLFVLLGLPIGILSTLAYESLRFWFAGLRDGRVKLSGTWAEWVPDSGDRQFSVGTIRFNLFRGQYVFDGTNYNNDGTPFCRWQTVAAHLDRKELEYHYTFESRDVGAGQSGSYGYGVVKLVRVGKELHPTDGFYMYAVGPRKAILCGHTLVKIDGSLIPATSSNVASELAQVFPHEWPIRASMLTVSPPSP